MTVLYCPTRRPVTTYPWIGSYGIVNAGQPSVVTRSDYAGNGGDQFTSLEYPNYALGTSSAELRSGACRNHASREPAGK